MRRLVRELALVFALVTGLAGVAAPVHCLAMRAASFNAAGNATGICTVHTDNPDDTSDHAAHAAAVTCAVCQALGTAILPTPPALAAAPGALPLAADQSVDRHRPTPAEAAFFDATGPPRA